MAIFPVKTEKKSCRLKIIIGIHGNNSLSVKSIPWLCQRQLDVIVSCAKEMLHAARLSLCLVPASYGHLWSEFTSILKPRPARSSDVCLLPMFVFESWF